MTKAVEYRELNDDELTARVSEYKQELFNLRFQDASGQLSSPSRISQVKRDIARCLLILREREIEASEADEGANA